MKNYFRLMVIMGFLSASTFAAAGIICPAEVQCTAKNGCPSTLDGNWSLVTVFNKKVDHVYRFAGAIAPKVLNTGSLCAFTVDGSKNGAFVEYSSNSILTYKSVRPGDWNPRGNGTMICSSPLNPLGCQFKQ